MIGLGFVVGFLYGVAFRQAIATGNQPLIALVLSLSILVALAGFFTR